MLLENSKWNEKKKIILILPHRRDSKQQKKIEKSPEKLWDVFGLMMNKNCFLGLSQKPMIQEKGEKAWIQIGRFVVAQSSLMWRLLYVDSEQVIVGLFNDSSITRQPWIFFFWCLEFGIFDRCMHIFILFKSQDWFWIE